jgi:hypothetical protein
MLAQCLCKEIRTTYRAFDKPAANSDLTIF